MSAAMNYELHELEAELKRLRPRAPSELCEARVEAVLAKTPIFVHGWRRAWRMLAISGVAAALALMAGLTKVSSANAALSPVAVENEVCDTHEDGVVKLADGSKVWRTRIQYVDTVRWSGGGRTLTLTTPREELRIVPLVAY
jgi:hypothetical protein